MSTEELGTGGESTDNKPFESDVFDIESAVDAGESELSQEAEKEAKRTSLNLSHRANEISFDKAEVYSEANLVKRIKTLLRFDPMAVKFVHFKKASGGDMDIGPRARTDSPMNRYAVFDALFDKGSGIVPYPHLDEFSGRCIDHYGLPLTKQYRSRELISVVDAAGMENPKEKEVSESILTWAEDHKRNSLISYIENKMPEWDGTSRLDSLLIKLFRPFETDLNKKFSRYFWLSLYMRLMFPGSLASISLALFGAQNAGKSWFSVMLCRTLMGRPDAGPIDLDLSVDHSVPFLRAITGKSIIANVGEMVGFNSGDLKRIKAFTTMTQDTFDHKFADPITKERQWIMIMDGNKYEGLQRDDTGNRRFYPMFVGQLPDEDGKPDWSKDFKVDFTDFEEEVWQVMAEARAWVDEKGVAAYNDFVREVSDDVSAFSDYERKHARGLVRSEELEESLHGVLVGAPYRLLGANSPVGGMMIEAALLRQILLAKGVKYSKNAMDPRMEAFGFYFKDKTWRYEFPNGEKPGGSPDERKAAGDSLIYDARKDILAKAINSKEYETSEISDIIMNFINAADIDTATGKIKQPSKSDGGF